MKGPKVVTKVTLVCQECGYTARRKLLGIAPGCYGVQETPCEQASCPRGHGELVRKDGHPTMKTGFL